MSHRKLPYLRRPVLVPRWVIGRELRAASAVADEEALRAENERLHDEIRGLNGQLDGLMRAMAGLRERLERVQAELAELKDGRE